MSNTPCTCRADIEAKLLERFVANTSNGSEHRAELTGYGICIVGNAMKSVPFMPVKCTVEIPIKAGRSRLKTSTMNMFFSFCPFCGASLQEGGAA